MSRIRGVQLGDTFWAGHLHVVCSEPDADGSVVIFNTTTMRSDSDRNCIIQPNELPSVNHVSVIAYERGHVMTKAQQEQLEESKEFATMRRSSASADVLRRIQEGALKSDQTPIEVQDIISDQVRS
ncbi:hypothetical protein [Candidatus Binatus sp.]|uniref:hypothetical protein n=1 Tax=Candidatus Binatus sp. TaxID=2811406 RepID=UPI002F41AC2C